MQSIRIVLSTPETFIISNATAVEALPEIGLISIKGSTWGGILSNPKKGDKAFWIKSKIPEFLSALIAKNNATRVGNILIVVAIPLLCTGLENYQKLWLFLSFRKQ